MTPINPSDPISRSESNKTPKPEIKLTDLPKDIVNNVLSYLPPKNQANLALTSKGLNVQVRSYNITKIVSELRAQLIPSLIALTKADNTKPSEAKTINDIREELELLFENFEKTHSKSHKNIHTLSKELNLNILPTILKLNKEHLKLIIEKLGISDSNLPTPSILTFKLMLTIEILKIDLASLTPLIKRTPVQQSWEVAREIISFIKKNGFIKEFMDIINTNIDSKMYKNDILQYISEPEDLNKKLTIDELFFIISNMKRYTEGDPDTEEKNGLSIMNHRLLHIQIRIIYAKAVSIVDDPSLIDDAKFTSLVKIFEMMEKYKITDQNAINQVKGYIKSYCKSKNYTRLVEALEKNSKVR